ncbi:extracellular solute-binding protein [Streptomyces shenzhenensis]
MKIRIRATALTAMSVTAVLTLAACGSGSDSTDAASGGSQEIVLYTDSDTGVQQLWENKLIPAFEKSHSGITVKFSTGDVSNQSAQLASLAASVKQDKAPPMDIVVDSGFLPDASSADLLSEITTSNVPNSAGITEAMKSSAAGVMPYRASAVVLAYDSEKVTTPPTTLPDLVRWIKDNPGQFAYNDPSTGGSGQGFVQAMLDSHLDEATVKAMSTGYDEDAQSGWDAGLKDLAALTPNVYQKTYPNGNEETLNLLGQGQVSMIPAWSDMFLTAKKNGTLPDSAKAVSISDPAMPGGPSSLAVPVNSKHQEAALELMNWVLEPEQQAGIVEAISGFPVIPSTELPKSAQSVFEGMDTSNVAPFYSSKSAADMNRKWSQRVA